ncbi:hypothetical protein MMC27_007799 [Xylographa pallens]|nr:hypothetical protein [Xylographa pallens]
MSSSVIFDSAPKADEPHQQITLEGQRQLNTTPRSIGKVSYSDNLSEEVQATTQHKVDDPETYAGPNTPAFRYNASLHPVDTSTSQAHSTITSNRASPLSAELRVQTDLWFPDKSRAGTKAVQTLGVEAPRQQIPSTSSLPVRTPSVKSALAAALQSGGSLSPASAVSSPGLGPLADITPLPSPIGPGGSPRTWRTMAGLSPLSPPSSTNGSEENDLDNELRIYGRTSPRKRKAYQGLISAIPGPPAYDPQILSANAESHARNRSLSEYAPGGVQIPRNRNIAVSGSQTPTNSDQPPLQPLHREEYLAIQRGISGLQSPRPPTPPRSTKSATSSTDLESPSTSPRANQGTLPLQYEARDVKNGVVKRWSAIRQLGKGTFSTVVLATSEDTFDADHISRSEEQLSARSLVAVKICEHGPAGGADEKKIESSLKRELDILESIDHPSLVHLKAVSVLDQRAFLVLNYSAGGDLFELASLHLDILVPSLIRRIFAELVAAVRYLHSKYIVHRDIKLESMPEFHIDPLLTPSNVLVNLPVSAIPSISDWQTYPTPIVTLTDLGLGRLIPKPPESPLLTTRCGSEDYAAPELLMGQEYDGRATDSWALGVLLYALMEGRLPFDPIPGARRQSPTSHRIARCEWSWIKWADADGEWDSERGSELEGARECVEGLLKRARTRWSLDVVGEKEWVRNGVGVTGGLKRDLTGDDE